MSTETISSLATHSSRWRSWARSEANTSAATASATGDSWWRRRRAATTGSRVAARLRAVNTTAAHHPCVCSVTARATSTESVRACSATRVAESRSSRRSSSPRSTVKWPSSSAPRRVMGRSHRDTRRTRRLSGASFSRSSISRTLASGSRWASSMTMRRGAGASGSWAASSASSTRARPQAPSAAIHRASSSPRLSSQPLTPRDLPDPIGPTSNVSAFGVAASSRSQSRVRGTYTRGSRGRWSPRTAEGTARASRPMRTLPRVEQPHRPRVGGCCRQPAATASLVRLGTVRHHRSRLVP